jgi:eukaryotic-like serine/threonine-protein kinase
VSIIGPYRILGSLGAGGMGVVYRGEHVETGAPAAVKTVRVPNEGLLQGFRREIRALARIRHPGIVRILDEGLQQGLPWYAMELLEGLTLRSYWRQRISAGGPAREADTTAKRLQPRGSSASWWTQALVPVTEATGLQGHGLGAAAHLTAETGISFGALPSGAGGPEASPRSSLRTRPPAAGGALLEALSVVRRLCAPLAFLHGEGIVHRDLKPDNILVRPDGLPVLVDFGLVTQFSDTLSREALEISEPVAGTAAYIAPEQIRGELVDARADLYALGCVLYEMVAGRQLFLGSTAQAVMAKHLEAEPIRPSELVEGVSADLEALILRLLAKQPQDRLGHADDVAVALAELGAKDGLAAAGPRPQPYLYRPRFAGRRKPLDFLAQSLSALAQGRGSLVLIGGESGVGKTRLAMEAARQARLRGVTVLAGECLPPGSGAQHGPGRYGSPLQGFRQPLQAMADRCRVRGPQETERLFGPRGKLLALYEPALSGLPALDAYPGPAELPPDAARLRLFSYLAESFEALAGAATGQPNSVLLLLDDLHWADELTSGFLQFLIQGRRLESVAWLVLGTYRSEETTEPLERLRQSAGVTPVRLDRLEDQALEDIVGDMLALTPPPARFVRFLSRHSEGNPFFVAEYLRTAVAERLLTRNDAGRWQIDLEAEEATEELYETLPLPRSLQDLVGRRLDGLSEAARELVAVASTLGREMDEVLLAQVASMSPAELLEPVQELFTRQVMEPLDGQRLRFAHDKLREVAYQRLGPSRRRQLHLAAAVALEQRRQEPSVELLSMLAHHWEQAGETQSARRYYLEAARGATKRYALEDAERLYRAHLRLVETPDSESVAVRNELGSEVLLVLGRYPQALSEHALALEQVRIIGDRAGEITSLLGLAQVHERMGEPEQVRTLHGKVLTLTEGSVELRSRGIALSSLGRLVCREGRRQEGIALVEQALELFRRLGERRLEAAALLSLWPIYLQEGRMESIQSISEQALALARQLGDQDLEADALKALAMHRHALGLFPEAHRFAEQALAICRRIGDLASEAEALSKVGMLHETQGHYQQACWFHERALELYRRIGDRLGESLELGNLGNTYAYLDRVDEAREVVEQALAIHRQNGDRRLEAMDLRSLSGLHLRQGQFEQAREICRQALELHREVDNRYGQTGSCREMATIERQSGSLAEAERFAGEAVALARGLGNPLFLAWCLCELGHVELARGRSGRPALEQAEGLARGANDPPESPLATALRQLRDAEEVFEAGGSLFRGQCIEHLTEAQRRRLVQAGRLAPTALGS